VDTPNCVQFGITGQGTLVFGVSMLGPQFGDVALVVFAVSDPFGNPAGTRRVRCSPGRSPLLWDCDAVIGGQVVPLTGGNAVAILARGSTGVPAPPEASAPAGAGPPGVSTGSSGQIGIPGAGLFPPLLPPPPIALPPLLPSPLLPPAIVPLGPPGELGGPPAGPAPEVPVIPEADGLTLLLVGVTALVLLARPWRRGRGP
jgi:hypothetical protein